MVIVAFILLVIILILGVPVPLAFLASSLFIVVTCSYSADFLLPYGYSKLSTVVLLAIPLFILAGSLMEKGKIGGQLVGLVETLVGHIRGGLGSVAVISCAVFGALTGSSMATLSCIGGIMFPQLNKNGYPTGHTAALLANAAVLGILIPPSSLMILYAWAAGQSVLACFLSTVIPGLILTTLFAILNLIMLRKCKTLVTEEPISLNMRTKMMASRTVKAAPALFMPFIVLGGIYMGIFTPTEAAAISVLYAVPIGFLVYKGLTLQTLKESLIESGTTTGVVMIMLYAVMILSRLFIQEDLPGVILGYMQHVTDTKLGVLLMLNLFMIVIAMLMDDVSAVMLCTPILVPVAIKIGVDPIHFAAIMSVNLGMGNVTPPCAPLLFLSASLNGASINDVIRPTFILIIFGWIPVLAITILFPEVALWVPKTFLGYVPMF